MSLLIADGSTRHLCIINRKGEHQFCSFPFLPSILVTLHPQRERGREGGVGGGGRKGENRNDSQWFEEQPCSMFLHWKHTLDEICFFPNVNFIQMPWVKLFTPLWYFKFGSFSDVLGWKVGCGLVLWLQRMKSELLTLTVSDPFMSVPYETIT